MLNSLLRSHARNNTRWNKIEELKKKRSSKLLEKDIYDSVVFLKISNCNSFHSFIQNAVQDLTKIPFNTYLLEENKEEKSLDF